MAIVDLINPVNGDSCQDSLWHIASSDASGLTNMKYVFDLYDSSGNQLVRTKIYPDVSTGRGIFDASSVIKNEINYDWFNFDVTLGQVQIYSPNLTNEAAATYRVEVGEEYSIGASGITVLNDASAQITAWNTFAPAFGRRQNINDRDLGFLTNRPLYAKNSIDTDEPLLIPFLINDDTDLNFTLYTANGTSIQTGSIALTASGLNPLQLNLSRNTINQNTGYDMADYGDGSYALFWHPDHTDKKFKVTFVCNRDYQPINVYFMNAYGLFDTARFDCTNKLSMNITRKTFDRKDVDFRFKDFMGSPQFGAYYTNEGKAYYESRLNYASDINWTYKLQMNFPTDAEWQWLSELIYSPQVYMMIDEYFYPITIKATNYEYFKQIYSKLKTFEVDVDVNQKRQGFRR